MFSLGYGYYATFILGLREEKTTISVRLLRLDSHALTLSPLGLQRSGLIGLGFGLRLRVHAEPFWLSIKRFGMRRISLK